MIDFFKLHVRKKSLLVVRKKLLDVRFFFLDVRKIVQKLDVRFFCRTKNLLGSTKNFSYCAVKKVFCKNYVGNVEKRLKNPKNSKIFENVQTLPIASECIQMHPNASEWIRKPRKARENLKKTCENFEKLRKHFEKLREKFYKNFFHGVVLPALKKIRTSSFDHF